MSNTLLCPAFVQYVFAKQTLKRNVRPLRARFKLLRGVHHVVKQAARFDEHRQRVFAQIRAKRYPLFIQIRQQHVAAFETQTAVGVFQMFRHLTQRRVRACLRCQLLACASQPRFAAREFNDRIDFYLLQT
ncbi:MAG: hypothetical protein V8T51_01670 [Senegalimassilia faecalis]